MLTEAQLVQAQVVVETKDLAAAETEEEIKIDKMVCMKIQTIFVFGQIQLS
jgi:hypothetical protein